MPYGNTHMEMVQCTIFLSLMKSMKEAYERERIENPGGMKDVSCKSKVQKVFNANLITLLPVFSIHDAISIVSGSFHPPSNSE